MIRRLLPLALVPVLAACSTGTSSQPHAQRPQSDPSSSQTTPSGMPLASATPITPHHAAASTASWQLPVPSARQALIQRRGSAVVAGGLLAGDRSTGQTYRVRLSDGRLTRLPDLAVPLHDAAGGLVSGTPTVFGGGNATEQAVIQSLRGGAWQVTGRLPTTRSDLSVAADGPRALVIGGYDGARVPTDVLSVGRTGGPRVVGRLVAGVRYAATARYDGAVYVFGGEVAGAELGTVQRVDLATGHTRVVGRLPMPLGHAMAATVGTRILLAGGRVGPDTQTGRIWLYDPATRTFAAAGSLPRPLSDAAVAVISRRVWLLGGETPDVTDQVVSVHVS